MALFAQASLNRKITSISSPVGSIIDGLATTFHRQLTLFLTAFEMKNSHGGGPLPPPQEMVRYYPQEAENWNISTPRDAMEGS